MSAAGFGRTVLVGLAGAALAATGSAQAWGTATTRSPALRTVTAQGSDVAPVALPLALVALAAWGTVLVLRRTGRRVVSVLGLLAAVGAGVVVVTEVSGAAGAAAELLSGGGEDVTTGTTLWPWATLLGCVLAAAGFVVALLRAHTWPEMSRRYDAPTGATGTAGTAAGDATARPAVPAEAEQMSDAELWRALDDGHDPTA